MAKTSLFSSTYMRAILMILAGVTLVYLASEYYKRNLSEVSEKFVDTTQSFDEDSDIVHNGLNPDLKQEIVGNVTDKVDKNYPVMPSEDDLNEQYKPIDYNQNPAVNDCFPRDKLTADDLLPKDAANSKWAQVNPAGQGELKNQNFLTAGYHVGINTVGTTLRNSNMQLRSEPMNPQMKVSPWNQTTIQPDLNRRPLEINESE
jgi:hypothetical protein